MVDQPVTAKTTVQTDEELTKVNKEIYERNVELAIRNRTLSLLRKMYEIMSSSLSVEDTSQRLADAIVNDLKFQKGLISLVDKKNQTLRTIAVSPNQPIDQKLRELLGGPFNQFNVPLNYKDNFCVASVIENKTRMTNDLYDVLVGAVDEKVSKEIQDILKIQTCILYPITFGKEVFGVLVLGMDKHVGSLSRAELESLRELVEVVGIAIERVRIYADLQVANQKLKELDKRKDEFLSVAAHELRAPMTAIKGYLSMIIEGDTGKISNQVLDFLNNTIEANDRLIRLVNNMLNVSRIEEGRLVYQMGTVNLAKVAKSVYNEFLLVAQQKGLQLYVETPEGIRDSVYVDKDRIHEVLANLVSNAVKYTDKGSVTIKLLQPNPQTIRCEIIDTGLGITKEEQTKLFQKFFRAESSIGKETGTGLGLYISRLLIEKFGGKISFNSEQGRGSTFSFELPVSLS